MEWTGVLPIKAGLEQVKYHPWSKNGSCPPDLSGLERAGHNARQFSGESKAALTTG
jgi:hypothetical protein